MAVHSGSVELSGGHYFGPALFRCARLQALGHGGQTLVSQAVADHLRDELPTGVTLLSLGSHRLKDLSEPERVYQLSAPGLPTETPPLCVPWARAPTTCPCSPRASSAGDTR